MKCNPRTKAKLHRLLDEFLTERVDGQGSWPKVERKDLAALYDIFIGIVDAKWPRDCDGDSVINLTLINRDVYAPLHFSPVKYEHKARTTEELMRIVSDRASHVRSAAENLDRSMSYLRISQEEAAKKGMTLDAYLAARRR